MMYDFLEEQTLSPVPFHSVCCIVLKYSVNFKPEDVTQLYFSESLVLKIYFCFCWVGFTALSQEN